MNLILWLIERFRIYHDQFPTFYHKKKCIFLHQKTALLYSLFCKERKKNNKEMLHVFVFSFLISFQVKKSCVRFINSTQNIRKKEYMYTPKNICDSVNYQIPVYFIFVIRYISMNQNILNISVLDRTLTDITQFPVSLQQVHCFE